MDLNAVLQNIMVALHTLKTEQERIQNQNNIMITSQQWIQNQNKMMQTAQERIETQNNLILSKLNSIKVPADALPTSTVNVPLIHTVDQIEMAPVQHLQIQTATSGQPTHNEDRTEIPQPIQRLQKQTANIRPTYNEDQIETSTPVQPRQVQNAESQLTPREFAPSKRSLQDPISIHANFGGNQRIRHSAENQNVADTSTVNSRSKKRREKRSIFGQDRPSTVVMKRSLKKKTVAVTGTVNSRSKKRREERSIFGQDRLSPAAMKRSAKKRTATTMGLWRTVKTLTSKEIELSKRFVKHDKSCYNCEQKICGVLFKWKVNVGEPAKYSCNDCIDERSQGWKALPFPWIDAVPDSPLRPGVDSTESSAVLHLWKVLTELGYTEGDASDSIWSVVARFRHQHKLRGSKMWLYNQSMEKMLRKKMEVMHSKKAAKMCLQNRRAVRT